MSWVLQFAGFCWMSVWQFFLEVPITLGFQRSLFTCHCSKKTDWKLGEVFFCHTSGVVFSAQRGKGEASAFPWLCATMEPNLIICGLGVFPSLNGVFLSLGVFPSRKGVFPVTCLGFTKNDSCKYTSRIPEDGWSYSHLKTEVQLWFQETSSHLENIETFSSFPSKQHKKTPSPGGMIHKIRENQKRSGDPSNQRGLSKKSWWEESTNLIWDLNQTSFHGKRKWLMTQLKPTYANIYIYIITY